MAKEGYTAAQLAESLGIEPKDLRIHLRALKIEKPEAGWVWEKKGDTKNIEKQVAARIKELANRPARAPKADPVEEPAKGKGKGKKAPVEEAPVETKGKKKAKEEPVAEEAPKKGKKKASE